MKRIHLLLAIFIVSWMASVANAQTLADLARQERARKQTLHTTTVLTNGSAPVPKAPETKKPSETKPTPAEAPKQAASPSPATAPTTPTGPTDNKGRDEKYWRATFE